MFYDACRFNQPLNNWDVSNVTDMQSMFYDAHNFNQPLDKWDVSNVKDMSCLFRHAYKYNHSLKNWNIVMGTYIDAMFDGSPYLQQQTLMFKPKKVKK